MNSKLLLFVSGLVLLWLLTDQWNSRPVKQPAGVLAPQLPLQSEVAAFSFTLDEYTLTHKASFSIRARVLSKERYYLDQGADLSPLDLALGWGVMSDQRVIEQLRISQSARWYRLYWDSNLPVPESKIMSSSGNMHMIPANQVIAESLKSVRQGQVINLEGYLVDAQRSDGWSWTTSLSREDVGGGSCELFYVEKVVTEE